MGRTQRDERRRALGQNLLACDRAISALLGAIPLDPGRDTVLDAGAGRGALTARLARRAARVVAVERDPDWARALGSRVAGLANVVVVAGDALAVPLPAAPFKVVSSPAFGIGTALLRRLLVEGHGMEAAALLLQLEAARRLAGGGRFAATWAPWYDLSLVGRVPAQAFRPVPRVDAGILRVTPRRPGLLSPAAFAAHADLVDAVFAVPGASVGARLAHAVGRRRASALLASSGLEPGLGAGAVAPEDWARLTRASREPSPGGPTAS